MEEKILMTKKNGMMVLLLTLLYAAIGIFLVVGGIIKGNDNSLFLPMFIPGIVMVTTFWLPLCGLIVLKPQEAVVLTLFGKYVGTIRGEGFYFVNPFCTAVNPAANTRLGQSGDVKSFHTPAAQAMGNSKKMSLKAMTLSNSKQKINDALGNPIEVGVAVVWTIRDTAKAAFNVENYKEFLSLQCDTAVRDIVKLYPYDIASNVDTTGDGMPDDGSLRGSTKVVADRIAALIHEKVQVAGLEIKEARITYLAYASEIAAAMLQRQQAQAIIDARMAIVDGAVSMVEMALDRLKTNGVVELDEERKAAMVSNLLVVLCGNHDAQPVVNSGSLY